jgi:hypothetical protein
MQSYKDMTDLKILYVNKPMGESNRAQSKPSLKSQISHTNRQPLDQEDGPDQQGVKSRHHQLLNVDNNG